MQRARQGLGHWLRTGPVELADQRRTLRERAVSAPRRRARASSPACAHAPPQGRGSSSTCSATALNGAGCAPTARTQLSATPHPPLARLGAADRQRAHMDRQRHVRAEERPKELLQVVLAAPGRGDLVDLVTKLLRAAWPPRRPRTAADRVDRGVGDRRAGNVYAIRSVPGGRPAVQLRTAPQAPAARRQSPSS